MSGASWPKEEQRLCNGACGQVPLTASCDDDESFEKKSRQAVIDTEVDAIWIESIARDQAGMGAPDRRNASERAAVLLGLVMFDIARALTAVVRESAAKIEAAILDTGAENAGAIDSMGTVIGAGLAEGMEEAYRRQTCRPGT